jgi:hypothetical protein
VALGDCGQLRGAGDAEVSKATQHRAEAKSQSGTLEIAGCRDCFRGRLADVHAWKLAPTGFGALTGHDGKQVKLANHVAVRGLLIMGNGLHLPPCGVCQLVGSIARGVVFAPGTTPAMRPFTGRGGGSFKTCGCRR